MKVVSSRLPVYIAVFLQLKPPRKAPAGMPLDSGKTKGTSKCRHHFFPHPTPTRSSSNWASAECGKLICPRHASTLLSVDSLFCCSFGVPGNERKTLFFPGASWFVSASGIGRFQVALHCWSEEWKEKKSARTLKIFTAEVPRKVDVEGVA